ncbi:nucleotidyltransferase family protein [Micromonospora sp. DT47]|uniref:nucleotidyltransferase family protein n=1 Tax=Micromonospora sp. DT47 TaxID=3393431 RepID=UPI003CEC5C39
MRVAGLVLAAGGGRRFGMPKALVRHDGQLLVDRSIVVLRAARCAPVVVVLGAAADDVRARAALDGVAAVDNPDWTTGMGSSLRAGLAALADTGAAATVVILVDMPGVTAAAVRRVAAGAGRAELVMAGYDNGRSGHPVLIGRDHWAGVAALAVGDVGARPYLRAHAGAVRVVPCADVADDEDLDLASRA